MLIEVLLQGNGVVVLGVVRAVQESHVILTGGLKDRLPGFGRATKLDEIFTAELLPLLRVVTEPLSQFGTGRGIFEPAIQV